MPNDDYIKRSDATREFAGFPNDLYYTSAIVAALEKVPASDVEPVRHGKWKRIVWVNDEDCYGGGYWILRCSECVVPNNKPSHYCPYCGAKMVEEADDE